MLTSVSVLVMIVHSVESVAGGSNCILCPCPFLAVESVSVKKRPSSMLEPVKNGLDIAPVKTRLASLTILQGPVATKIFTQPTIHSSQSSSTSNLRIMQDSVISRLAV